MAGFLIRCAVAGAVATGVRCVIKVDRLFPERCGQFLEGCVLRTAQEDLAVHVANDGIGVVLVQCFELRLCLQHQAGRDFPTADGGHQLLQVRDLPDIGTLVDQAAHMDGQPPAIHVICLFAQQIEKLGANHADNEIKRRIRVGHNEEQRRFLVSQSIQFQLVIGGNLPQFGNVKRG